MALGITMIATHSDDTAPGAGPWIIWGVIFILASIATPAITVIVLAVQGLWGEHQAWLDSKPPSQQAATRRADQIAAWTATSVAAVALHEYTMHVRERRQAQRAAQQQAWTEQRGHHECCPLSSNPGSRRVRIR
jgi:hypothetical protein